MGIDKFFRNNYIKQQYLKAEKKVTENERDKKDTLFEDTYRTIWALFKSCVPSFDNAS